ncbi:hypothetical protein L2Y96_11635 [Luteibacter aegosomaticola]|uniref:alpha/beta fold hydrolase n=1 Tax=Luteibacter aegosomaticola TaxID=2911538 RepID=UPI001FF764ED|nr:hypothetical protein [Luteibacter aegosomaticola]UPG88071.1 hypothetical protein L2Y96_11635 [Luteibacter aegosomaticola]
MSNPTQLRPMLHALKQAAAELPAAKLKVLPGRGHLLPLEAPADVAAHIAAWLAIQHGSRISA